MQPCTWWAAAAADMESQHWYGTEGNLGATLRRAPCAPDFEFSAPRLNEIRLVQRYLAAAGFKLRGDCKPILVMK